MNLFSGRLAPLTITREPVADVDGEHSQRQTQEVEQAYDRFVNVHNAYITRDYGQGAVLVHTGLAHLAGMTQKDTGIIQDSIAQYRGQLDRTDVPAPLGLPGPEIAYAAVSRAAEALDQPLDPETADLALYLANTQAQENPTLANARADHFAGIVARKAAR